MCIRYSAYTYTNIGSFHDELAPRSRYRPVERGAGCKNIARSVSHYDLLIQQKVYIEVLSRHFT